MNFQANYEPHHDSLQAINVPAFLTALSACESNHNDSAVGKHGERGRYQIKESVWSTYGRGLFKIAAHNPVASRDCATRYLRMLGRTLLDHHIVPNVTDLATLWNRGTLLHGPNDFANRVTNLYYDTLKSPSSEATPPSLSPGNRR